MAGSSNLKQWNPTGANMQTDSAYEGDSQRANGAISPSLFDSALANKLFYQLTTLVKALGDMLAAKGYSVSDTSVTDLAAVLANIETLADFPASLDARGWQKYPSGLIEQWGIDIFSPSGNSITFPIPFPHACFGVVTGEIDFTITSPFATHLGVQSITLTSFIGWVNVGAERYSYWQAKGK